MNGNHTVVVFSFRLCRSPVSKCPHCSAEFFGSNHYLVGFLPVGVFTQGKCQAPTQSIDFVLSQTVQSPKFIQSRDARQQQCVLQMPVGLAIANIQQR